MTYRTVEVAVDGGALRVGVWEPAEPARTVLLVHGVTASHLAWSWLAEAMPDARLIAPDLRGRGRSSALPGPFGMSAHAADLVAVLDAFDVSSADVAGHSMGAFVALMLAAQHPQRVSRIVLVDGGLPLDLPPGMTAPEAVRHVLGATARRLDMRFASAETYLDFWRTHPAFTDDWSPVLERYFAYDLVGEAPHLRPATTLATVEADSLDQNAGSAVSDALAHLRPGTILLAAERGLADEVPPLYDPARRATLEQQHPGLVIAGVAGVNHYTITMSPRGARVIADALSP